MLIRLLCAHEMLKHVCKISHLNSKRLLRILQKILGGYFFAAPCTYTVSKKVNPLMFDNNFGECRPVFKILSPIDS